MDYSLSCGERLDELDARAEKLQMSAGQFSSARREADECEQTTLFQLVEAKVRLFEWKETSVAQLLILFSERSAWSDDVGS